MSHLALLIFVALASTTLALPSLNRSLKIVNGNTVSINKYPYVAAIWKFDSAINATYFCSGVVIRKRYLITTAQCVAGIKLTSWMITTNSNYTNGQGGKWTYVANVTVHPQYNQFKLTNNIAVVKTTNDMLNDVKDLAMFAPENYAISDRESVSVAGFGAISQYGLEAIRLNEGFTSFIAWSRCVSQTDHESADDGVFCFGEAHYNRPGACDGDQGGPVVHRGTVVGLISEVKKCGNPTPDIAVSISKYAKWINNTAV